MPWFRAKALTPSPDAAAAEELGQVLADVRRVEVRSSRMITDVLSGGYRSTFRGLGVEFSEVREYVEGDDPRSVDWNVTARVGRPFVKRFVEERERTLVFVVDLSPSMAFGLGAWSLRQVASRYCAMLGLMAIDNHDRVGLVAGDRFVLPQPGGGHVLRVLDDCVKLPFEGPGRLGERIATATARVRRRAVVFVLSDFLSPGYEHALTLCGRRHDVVAVRLWPRELVDPPRRLLRALVPADGDGDGGQRLCDFADARFREAWFARVAAARAGHDDVLGRAKVDGIDVETPAEPDIRTLAAPLLRFFRRREARR
ncbi:MAG: DUF58 domain-containing protein [Planctomycetes bacterium]|nr:DUF58 domain-containing protein [Planctomycetota bacterium]